MAAGLPGTGAGHPDRHRIAASSACRNALRIVTAHTLSPPGSWRQSPDEGERSRDMLPRPAAGTAGPELAGQPRVPSRNTAMMESSDA
jgi:hypothetical protein